MKTDIRVLCTFVVTIIALVICYIKHFYEFAHTLYGPLIVIVGIAIVVVNSLAMFFVSEFGGRHFAYFKYIIKHKWFVLLASRQLKVSLWRAFIHDISKFRPSEWIPYANTFYNKDGSSRYQETKEFNLAWNHHQKRNKHHWQYWTLVKDDGKLICLEIPEKYVREMIADWIGAGKSITGSWRDVFNWYQNNQNSIKINPKTKRLTDDILKELEDRTFVTKFMQRF